MLAIKIDNPDIENRFHKYAKTEKETIENIITKALKQFLDSNSSNGEIAYEKKDPMKHLRAIDYGYDDDEDLSDVKPYSHIKNSAEYVHNLRRINHRWYF